MFDPTTFTGFHTWLSLIAIAAGVVVVIGLLNARSLPGWTTLFLATAIATSATGFGFPFTTVLPSHIVGVVALVVLVVALVARYGFRLAGAWRWAYALAAVASLYFLVFVAIAQAFAKVPALNALAPTGPAEPVFAAVQGVALVAFVALAVLAARSFRPAAAKALA